MTNFICETCGKPFQNYNKASKFCSKKCANARYNENHIWTCIQCGKKFHKAASRIPNKKRVFCSRRCYGDHKAAQGVDVVCTRCGKQFKVAKSSYSQHGRKYCSQECFGLDKRTTNYNKNVAVIKSWRQSLGWNTFGADWIREHPFCESCNVQNRGNNLCVHHEIDPNIEQSAELLFDQSNLVVLCRRCHMYFHKYGTYPTKKHEYMNMKHCEHCGQDFFTQNNPTGQRRRYCSRGCAVQAAWDKRKASLPDGGKKHFDKTHCNRSEFNEWRKEHGWGPFATAWIRSHPVCGECNKAKDGRNLMVHHKENPNEEKSVDMLFRPSNLVVLCHSCHIALHQAPVNPPTP